jgi:hypothetical protein
VSTGAWSVQDFPFLNNPPTVFDVTAYGAIGNGIADDSLAIYNAVTAATAASGTLYFPSKVKYYFNPSGGPTSAPLGWSIPVTQALAGIIAPGSSFISAGPSATDCFTFGPNGSFYGFYQLPPISNFTNGTAVRLKGVGQAIINVPYINNCLYGIGVESSTPGGYPNCVNNTITFQIISNCLSGGIHVSPNSDSDFLQSNIFNGNYLLSNYYGVFYDKGTGTITNSGNCCSINYFNISAFDGVPSTISGHWAVFGNFPSVADTYEVPNYFDNFVTGMVSLASGSVGMKFRLSQLNSIPTAYSAWTNLSGVNNLVTMRPLGNTATAITAVSATNLRASFNAGTPVYLGSLQLAFPLSTFTIAAGNSRTFYAYSPYTNGNNTSMVLQPLWSGTPGLVVQSVNDNSLVHPNEIAITLYNTTSGTINSVVSGNLLINQ